MWTNTNEFVVENAEKPAWQNVQAELNGPQQGSMPPYSPGGGGGGKPAPFPGAYGPPPSGAPPPYTYGGNGHFAPPPPPQAASNVAEASPCPHVGCRRSRSPSWCHQDYVRVVLLRRAGAPPSEQPSSAIPCAERHRAHSESAQGVQEQAERSESAPRSMHTVRWTVEDAQLTALAP